MKKLLKLLILEDNQDDIILIKEMMNDLHSLDSNDTFFELIFLSTLKEGIDYLATHNVDLILLDLSLPDSFRLNTLKNINKKGASPDIPIIILTALDDKETGIEAVKLGAQEYLVKGHITADLLAKSIQYAMERHLLKMQLQRETEILRRNEEQLIKIITNDPDGMVIVDQLEIIRFVNPAAERLLNRSRKELLGKRFGFPFPTDESVKTDIDIPRPKGKNVTVELRSVAIDWRCKKAWLISLRDVSRKKKLIRAFQEEKEWLDVTLRSIADGMIAEDEKGIIRIINPVAMRMIGVSSEEAIGNGCDKILILKNKSSGKTTYRPGARVRETGKIFYSTGTGDWVIITRNGNEIPVEFSCAPILKLDENLGLVWIISDVREKKELEEESLRIQNLEALGILAGGIAHEYNNILTSTMGYISLAKIALKGQEEYMPHLEKIEQASLRAKEISGRLLTFSKGGEPRKKCGSIIQTLEIAANQSLHFPYYISSWDIQPNLWHAEFDPDQISLAVKNIIKNSMEAMPDGGDIKFKLENIRVPYIRHSNIKPGNYIKISIKDHGVGVSPDHLKKVFIPYFTTKEKAEGMGLTTVYSITRKHGGWMRLKSKGINGLGCEVSMLVPAVRVKNKVDNNISRMITPVSSPRAPKTANNYSPGFINKSGKGKILVMDDEDYIRDVAKEMLETLEYQSETAESGEEALHLYKMAKENGFPFFAVILDLVIPSGMGGKECIRRLREFDPQIKAIVSSGYSNDPVVANYRDYGFCGVLPKPYQISELKDVLEKIDF